MLVICEDCAKKYSIDEKRIKAPKVKFNCRACGHIIVVEKPKSIGKTGSEDPHTPPSFPDTDVDRGAAGQDTRETKKKEQGQKKRSASLLPSLHLRYGQLSGTRSPQPVKDPPFLFISWQ